MENRTVAALIRANPSAALAEPTKSAGLHRVGAKLRTWACSMVLVILVLPVLYAMNPLASHQWKNRLLVVTLEPSDTGKLPALLEEFSEEIKERDLRLFPVGFSLTHPSVEKMTEEETLWLTTHLRLRPGTTELLLLGKDGQIKERIDRIDLPLIFSQIDRMPMRRAEREREARD